MTRRDVIVGLLVAAAAGRAWAEQTGKVYRIAIAHPSQPATDLREGSPSPTTRAIFEELRRLGYAEGENLLIERYSGEGHAAHYPELAREAVRRQPDLVIVIGSELTLDFKTATTSIPIVGAWADPIGMGIVPSLAKPGGNITGVTVDVGVEQWGKRCELLKELAPQATKIGVLESPAGRKSFPPIARENIQRLGITWVGPTLDRPIDQAEYGRVFARLAEEGTEGLLVSDEAENTTNRRLIVELAARGRLPTIYPFRDYVELGGLMSYGINLPDIGHQVADIADMILKGAKPVDLPVEQPTKFFRRSLV